MRKKFCPLLLLSLSLGFSTIFGSLALANTNTTFISHSDLTENNTEVPSPRLPLPDPAQYRYQKEELSAFVHFGPNTFENVEWGERYGNRHPRDLFRLREDFDAETLIRTLKEAGFKRVIVTAKHHDGFCLWNSRYTDYDVANTDYKGGNGDILEEISAAATRHGMDMGLYLSPWDIHEPSYGYRDRDGQPLTRRVNNQDLPKEGLTWEDVEAQDANGDYNEFYNNQLEEILSQDKYGNAGRFVEVWMDGAKGSGANTQNYTFERWFETIQRNEGIEAGRDADALLFGAAGRTTVRWIGNEHGHAHTTTWSPTRVRRDSEGRIIDIVTPRTDNLYTQGNEDGEKWTVPEADARITSGWFWGPGKKTPKSMKQLSDMYYRSVGHNSVLLLNVPPNTEGKVDDEILERVREFGEAIRNTFSVNHAKNATISASSVRGNDTRFSPNNLIDANDDTYWTTNDDVNTGTLYFDFGEEKHFDVVSIEEAIKLGQRVTRYRVEYSRDNVRWEVFEEGTTIGAKRLAKNNAVRARYAKVTVSTTNTPPVISEVGFYKASANFAPKVARRPDGVVVIDNTDKNIEDGFGFVYENTANQNTNWKQEKGDQYLNKTNMWARPGTTAEIKFTGTKLLLVGTKDTNHGEFEITIDDGEAQIIDTRVGPRKVGEIIFESDKLQDGPHTARIRVRSRAVGIEGAYVINNQGKGIFEIEYPEYTMEENSTMNVKIKRVGGSTGEARVTVQNNPGSAVQSEYDADLSEELIFEEGVEEKEVTVRTKRQTRKTGTLNFTIELVNPVGASLGFNIEAIINIEDLEKYDKTYLQEALNTLYVSEENYSGGMDEFKAIKERAMAILSSDDPSAEDIIAIVDELETAFSNLEARTNYTDEAPFKFPEDTETLKILEAEMAKELINAPEERWHLERRQGNWASNGLFINSLNNEDQIIFPYTAKKPGVYQAIAHFRSGSTVNRLKWFEKNNKILPGEVSAGSNNASQTRQVRFEFTINKAGNGELVFEGPIQNSPQLDKIEFRFLRELENTEEEEETDETADTGETEDDNSSTDTPSTGEGNNTNETTPTTDTSNNLDFTQIDESIKKANLLLNKIFKKENKEESVVTKYDEFVQSLNYMINEFNENRNAEDIEQEDINLVNAILVETIKEFENFLNSHQEETNTDSTTEDNSSTTTPSNNNQSSSSSGSSSSSSYGYSGGYSLRGSSSGSKTTNFNKIDSYIDILDGRWRHIGNKWNFLLNNGRLLQNKLVDIRKNKASDKRILYAFDENAHLRISWFLLDGEWYYAYTSNDENHGRLATGWLYSDKYKAWFYLDPVSAKMATGWKEINKKWYYFSKDRNLKTLGALYQNETTPDNYKVDIDGVWIK